MLDQFKIICIGDGGPLGGVGHSVVDYVSDIFVITMQFNCGRSIVISGVDCNVTSG